MSELAVVFVALCLFVCVVVVVVVVVVDVIWTTSGKINVSGVKQLPAYFVIRERAPPGTLPLVSMFLFLFLLLFS